MTGRASFAFRPEHKLSRSADYSEVFKRPLRVSHAAFTLLARPSGQCTARLGLAVAKRQVASSVDRHRIKRVAREWFRLVREDLPRCDIIFLCRASAAALSNAELSQELNRQLRRLGKLCEQSSAP